MATDPLRGEAEIELGGKKYPLKLTLPAVQQMEIEASSSWQALINGAIAGELRIDHIAAVLWGGMIGAGLENPPSYSEVVAMVFDEGLIKTNPVVRDLMLLQAVGQKRAGEVAAMVEGMAAEVQDAVKV